MSAAYVRPASFCLESSSRHPFSEHPILYLTQRMSMRTVSVLHVSFFPIDTR